jgi:hypothetical protein
VTLMSAIASGAFFFSMKFSFVWDRSLKRRFAFAHPGARSAVPQQKRS